MLIQRRTQHTKYFHTECTEFVHTDYIYPYMLQEDQRIQKSGVCLQATGIIKIKQIRERV